MKFKVVPVFKDDLVFIFLYILNKISFVNNPFSNCLHKIVASASKSCICISGHCKTLGHLKQHITIRRPSSLRQNTKTAKMMNKFTLCTVIICIVLQ